MKLKSKAMLGAAVAAVAAIGFWEARRRLASAFLWRGRTLFGRTRVYQVADDDGCPVRLLEVGGIVQSGTYLEERYTELVFEYLRCYDRMFTLNPGTRRICVLGCGGYDYPEHLIANHPDVTVDAVEVDPSITAIAQRFFYLDRLVEEYETELNGRLNLICADALDHLENTDEIYDAVVNDAFDAGTPPPHLATEEFARAVHDRLADGGLYLTNIVAALEGPRSAFLHEQVALLERIFDRVEIVPCAEDEFANEDNVIVIARKGGERQTADHPPSQPLARE